MSVKARQEILADLQKAIVALEKRHVLDPVVDFGLGRDPANTTGGSGAPLSLQPPIAQPPFAPAGSLNEVWVDGHRDSGAALGFTFAQAHHLLKGPRSIVLWLHLFRDGAEIGLPYGPGLTAFGIAPEQIVLGQMKRVEDILWAIEEAIACRSVAAVVADIAYPHKVIDFTVSRRLGLRAQKAGTTVFMMRYGQNREASAAQFRWRVGALQSAPNAFNARALGALRWQLHLEKCHQKAAFFGGRDHWILNWTKDGLDIDRDRARDWHYAPTATPVSGALPTFMGERLPQTA
jgi:protein ImuA